MPRSDVLRVVVHTVGRTRERGWETLAASEYATRLERGRPVVRARTSFHPTGDALSRAVQELIAPVVVLHEDGEQMGSADFAAMLWELHGKFDRVSFVIGGADGLPPELMPADGSTFRHISLSRMTFPHRLARVLLLEQVFRAREIWAASHYPK
ncbi:unnamed protein product [Effrenium voratum]|uniref:Ribosomal RNA large subunit methyltransferase H n=1 Tax=Effrenium voratum TaxID=2562239 RepID=A0AA36I1N3_9DINO|nr:unnamed protein product [Effrenium voratum]CAJ1422883.1 unnamed protein product [Effrenium voratum]